MPQEFRIPLKPQKSKRPKNLKVPLDASRRTSGRFYNQMNDKNKSGYDQRVLNNVSNTSGHTLTPEGIKRPVGWIHTWGTLLAMVPPLDLPNQQMALKRTPPAFEVNTRIDVRRDGNQTRIHSFVSTSTINREGIQSPLSLNRTHTKTRPSSSIALPFASARSLFDNQTFYHQTSTSVPQDIDVAKRAHELSVFFHQKVHDLYQLVNCTTMRRTDQVKTWIVTGESVEQTSFTTVCQGAIGRAEAQNNQGMKKESELSPLPNMTTMTDQVTYLFSAEEVAQKLSKSFQAVFENKQNATEDNPTNVHNQVTETFWKGLTDLFYQFFSQHEYTASTQELNEARGSLISYFTDWLLSTFSVNYGQQVPNHHQAAKNRQIPMTIHPIDNSISAKASQKKTSHEKQENSDRELPFKKGRGSALEAKPTLSLEEESFLSSFWHLAEDFFGKVDGFIEHFKFNVFPKLGAEARPIPIPVEEVKEVLMGWKKLSVGTTIKINQIMSDYLNNLPLTVPNKEALPDFWYDYETFQLRHKIQEVNQKVKDYLSGQGVSCAELSGVELLNAIENWEEKEGQETKINRRKHLASVIREASGLQKIDLTYQEATNILLQWRNNNIFQRYKFEDRKQPAPKESQPTTLEEPVTMEVTTVNTQTNVTTSTTQLPPEMDAPKLKYSEGIPKETRVAIEEVIQTYIHGFSIAKLFSETIPPDLPPFWYDLEVFKKRDHVEKVNKKVERIICKKGKRCRNIPAQTLFLEIRYLERIKDVKTVRDKRKKIAEGILKASELPYENLSDQDVPAIILQWQSNNIFKSYQFKEIHQIHTETTDSLNENQSNKTTELIIETSSVKEQAEKATSSITQSSSPSVELSAEAIKINSIITAFFEGKTSPVPISEKLSLFMDDVEVYKKRNKTDYVNDKIKEFLCTQKEPCDGLSSLQLINTLYGWLWKEGEEKKKTRSKKVADVILSASGLAGQEVSDDRASAIIQQWRNNNIFKEYQIKEPKQILTEMKESLKENPSNLTTGLPMEISSVAYQVEEILPPTAQPSTLSEENLEDMNKINRMITAYFEGKPSPVPTSEKLPLILYDAEVYKKQNETDHVNDKVKEFLCEQKVPCKKLAPPQLITATVEWIREGRNKGRLTRSKEVAKVILNSSGLVGQEISDDRASTIILQWRGNNIFKGYQFKYILKTYHEPPTEVYNTIVVLNENHLNTTSHASQYKKGSGLNLSTSSNTTTEMPIDTSFDKTSTSKVQSPNTSDEMYLDFTGKVSSIITTFLEGNPSPVPTTEVLPTYYYAGVYEVYKKRHKTPKVNEAIKKLLCVQKIPCEDLSLLQLITATQGWIRKEGRETGKTRIRLVAGIILTSSGIASHTFSNHQANAILMQWRNNNIFKDYEFHEPSSDAQIFKNSEPFGMITYTNLYTYGILSLTGTAMVNKFHVAYLSKHPMTLPTYEPLLPFWYDFALFQKRNETEKANEAISQFLAKQEEFSEGLPSQPTAIVAREWVYDKQTDAEILARQKQLASIILEGYGIRRNLTATEAVKTVLQWENNNVFKDYTFIEFKQSSLSEKQFRNEPLTENSKMGVVPDTTKDPELEFVHEIVEDIVNNVPPAKRYSEPLPIFYYHFFLFQKRNETSNVNKKMQEFFIKEGIAIKETISSELEKATRQWIEKRNTISSSDKSERKQFLAYFLLKAYGVEDLRLGDFLSSIKVQAIFNQWKANTLLEGYTYQEISYTTIHHQLSKAEAPSVIRLKEQKKESQQIYADFIHDRTPMISKNQPIQTIYYHRALFEKRAETPTVNEAVRKLLIKQDVTFRNLSASELVRGMQSWILEGTTYETILERERQVAQLLQKAYGLVVKEGTVKETRYLLLQWENNNAQVGYSYKDTNTFEAIEISAVEVNEEEKERIGVFTRENKALPLTGVTSVAKEEKLPEWSEEQKEAIRKKIVAFLKSKNLEVDVSKTNKLMKKMTRWATRKVEGEETTDFKKVKILVNIILGKKEDAVISEEKAQAIFTKWLLDNIEEKTPILTSTESPKEEMTQTTETVETTETASVQPSVSGKQTPKYEVPNWRDKNLRIQVAQFFRQEEVLKGESTIENILFAMGKWFTEERGEMVLSYSKLQSLSKVILKELNLYGGEGEEKISDKDARLTTMKWVSENILGSSMEAYMIKKILDSPDPSQFTIGYLRKIFEMDELKKGGYITLHTLGNVSKEGEDTVKKLWILLLKDTLPNYFLETNTLPDELLISNYDSLMQLTGARLLADLGIQAQFNQEEIQTFGTFIWDKISKNGIKRVEELRYTVLPALLAVAQLDPDLLRKALKKGNYHEVALSTFIEYHQNGYLQLKEYQDTLYTLFTAYQKEALNWRRKQALAQEVAQTYLQHAKGESLFPAFVLEQDYLLGMTLSINDYTSPNLEEWYTRLTKAVSDTHFSLDQKLIEFALSVFDPEEREFIFSPEAQLYEASAELKEVLDGSPGGPPEGEVVNLFLVKMLELKNRILHLENTDLFVAVNGEEERWYALKALDGGGYAFYRVDKDPLSYLKYGLLEQKNIWSRGYKKDREGVRTGQRYFKFSTQMDQNKKLSQGEEIQPLIDSFSRKHSDKLYEALYKSGDDKAILEQIWDFVKHFIPFYDCVTGIIDKDATVAIPSCTLDIVFLIPIFGQATSLSSKFAMGMAKAMVKGGVRNAIRQGARFTPKISEIKSVLVNIRRYLDPGIESITEGSKFVVKELVSLKNEVWVKKNTKKILGKIDGLVEETPTLPKDTIRTYLPGKGLEVSAKRMEKESYRLVTDLKSGDVYGNPFWLKGTQLARFTDPEPLTEEQKALINRLTKEIDPDQIFAVAPNLNPKAYGSGEVMSILENEQTTKYFITLNGHIVPVRVTPIEEHGVRYDVVDGEKVYPVIYNGKEWHFEPATSPFISKKLADEVINNIDDFESIRDPSTLSASGDRGLRWDSFGRSYIKIYGYYIPLIQLYKHWDWYHLVKKDIHQSMTVLVFEPENEQFIPETSLDRELRKDGRQRQAESRPSRENNRQESKEVELPPAGTLPEPPGRSEEWNEFRNVIEHEFEKFPIKIVGDENLCIDALSKFIPEPRPYINKNEEYFKDKILEAIVASFKGQPLEFRIYNSLNLNKTPNFLKPFVLELLQDYKKAQERFRKAFEVCQEVLTKEKIADSPQGQYLIKMFSLEMVKNPEPILLEIVQRVKSVSKNGLEFLQKTADWGYENILIASSDLVLQEGSQEYRSASQEFLSTYGFTFPDDPECRIIFVADTFYLNPDLDKGKKINLAKSQILIHETTHAVSHTGDLAKYYRERIGIKKTGKMLLEEYQRQYSTMINTIAYKRFVRELAMYQNKPGLSLLNVWEEIMRNDLLRANLQISDAEMVMFIIRDFADKRNFEGAIRETRSLKDSTIGDGLMFMFSAVVNIYNYGSFEKDPELDMEQEQTTDNPELTGAVTNESDPSTTVKREKRDVAAKNMGSTEDSSNRSLLNLKGMSQKNSNNISPSSNQQIDTELSKSTEKKSFLDIVVTSIERSIKSNPRTVLNQPISKNSLQH